MDSISNTEIISINGQNTVLKVAGVAATSTASYITGDFVIQLLTIAFLASQLYIIWPKVKQRWRAQREGRDVEVDIK